MRSDAVATLAAAAAAAAASSLTPETKALSLRPVALNASQWLGIDGNWSTYSFLIGNDNPVNVLFSTSISEFWAVGPGGCAFDKNEAQCTTNRGGIYYPTDSKHWSGLGTWQLDIPYLGGSGIGQYGFDAIEFSSPITNVTFGMSNVIMSAIASSQYFLGCFGVGLRSGSFGDVVASPPLRQAVSSYGWIPSYSYGYTAGASYRGIIGSATLGGYDAARFVPHNDEFTLDLSEGVPRARVRGIQLSAKNGSTPTGWASASKHLMTYNQTFTAFIDSSLPYLWLPPGICDAFAKALNMSYNDTFGVYTLTDEQYLDYSSSTNPLSFTFSLSSKDNNNNFGLPLVVSGVVNITLPIRSFVSLLNHPFLNATTRQDDAAVPYFTLRKGTNDSFIIGNAFMQEAYIITKYDSGTFSLHQAKFPRDPIRGAQLQAIEQPPGSPFPPPATTNSEKGLSTGQVVGIAVGAVAFCSLVLLVLFLHRRHRRQQRERVGHELDDGKATSSILTPHPSRSAVSRMLARIVGGKLLRRNDAVLTTQEAKAFEAAEAADCQIYELPAPVPPAELDAGGTHDDDASSLGDADLGTDSTRSLTAYEMARGKLERQLRGPVPEYTPPADGAFMPHEKTCIPDLQSSQITQTAADGHLPAILARQSRAAAESMTDTYIGSEPSSVSAPRDWSPGGSPPSPVAVSVPPRTDSSGYTSTGPSATSQSVSANSNEAALPTANDTQPSPVPAACQKAPIDTSTFVCLGPLPKNAQLPGQSAANNKSRVVTTAGRGLPPPGTLAAESSASMGSLGSNFTKEQEEDEAAAAAAAARNPAQAHAQQGVSSSKSTSSPPASASRMTNEHLPPPSRPEKAHDGQGPLTSEAHRSDPSCSEESCINPGRGDLVHVPQVAHKRYSWEDVCTPRGD